MSVTLEYDEMGGYDCMSPAFIVKQQHQVLAEVDIRHYDMGQSSLDKLDAITRARKVAEVIRAALEEASRGNLY